MFELTKEENQSLRSQNVTFKRGQHYKYLPFAFTAQGVTLLSSVLKNDRSIHVNIQIMRAFTQLRQMLSTHEDLKRKIESMERKNTMKISRSFFKRSKQMLKTDEKPKKIYSVKSKCTTYT